MSGFGQFAFGYSPFAPPVLLPPPGRTLVYGSSGVPYLQWPVAEPDDNLDYSLDLASVLSEQSDTAVTISVSASPSGAGELLITQLYADGDLVVVWLQGGVASRVYKVRVDVTTINGREYSLIAKLAVSDDTAVPPVPLPPSPGFGAAITWTPGAVVVGPFSLVATGLIGTGTNQATAMPFAALTNVIASAPVGAGFILPTFVVLGTIVVQNDDQTNNAAIYPPVGARINALAVNQPFYVGSTDGRINFSTNSPSTQWYAA